MSATSSSPLSAAIAALIEAAQVAGVEESVARQEGEDLAAAVAESSIGAYAAWVAQTGGDRDAEDFTAAAGRGRRWRSTPTPTMSSLAAQGNPHAQAYGKALAMICTSAAMLGQPSTAAVGAASSAAAAQLGAFAPPSSGDDTPISVPETGRVVPTRRGGEEATAVVRGLWDDVMGQLSALRPKIEELRSGPAPTRSSGSDFDLDPGADPWGPGAFSFDPNTSSSSGHDTPTSGPEKGRVVPTRRGEAGVSAGPERSAGPEQGEQPEQSAEPEVPAEPEKSLEELLAELDALIGLAEVKAEIHRQVAVLRLEAKRAAAGLKTPNLTRHLVFVGNPGTGKTTVARLVGGIYRALGLLSQGQLIECDRSELVAGYLGQTAIKTAEIVDKAHGGVLFIDEAYALAGDQYGTEAVDTLVKEMEDKRDDLVVIVAGYPAPMQLFIAQNPGLASRFRTTIDFSDYTDDELVSIFTSMAAGSDYDLAEEVESRLRALLAAAERGPAFGNGRHVRNLFEGAIGRHAWRLREVEEPTVEQLRSLDADDLGDAPNPLTADGPIAPEGEAQLPPEGEAQLPPEGGAQLPPEGGAQLPPEGGAQLPPEGEAQLPPEREVQLPPTTDGPISLQEEQ